MNIQEIVEIQKQTNNFLVTKNIEIKLDIPKTAEDIVIKTDENRFIQIFNNLINNAIKFSKEEDPKIIISLSKKCV